MLNKLFSVLLVTTCLVSACSSKKDSLQPLYQAVLYSDGGENQFPIYMKSSVDQLQAFVINGVDTVRFTTIELNTSLFAPDSIRLSLDHYDSHITALIKEDGSWVGEWKKRIAGGGYDKMPFSAKPITSFQRYEVHQPENTLFDGEWDVLFTDKDGKSYPATGIFYTDKKAFYGTFLTETGDYRFLEGAVKDSSFIISDFDGGHAFRFNARLLEDGSLVGDFYSRKTYHETFTAARGKAALTDPFSIAELSSKNAQLEFSFKDLNGNQISITDDQFKNKPILLYLFGSWCPNCADETKMMFQLYEEQFKNTDLQIVGLAFEYSGDFESDAEMVKKYKQRFSIPWTTLIAGISDKQSASDLLPFVKKVTAFPTVFFADRNHTIKASHVGFKGPGTGSYFIQEKNNFINQIQSILN